MPAQIEKSPARSTKTPAKGASLPATGVVLIGTRACVRLMAGQLAAMEQTVIPVGCVLLDHLPGMRAGDAGTIGVLPPILGHLDDLIDLHARYQFKTALVSIPSSNSVLLRRTRALLKQLDIPERFIPTFEDLLSGSPSIAARAGGVVVDPVQLVGRSPYGLNRKQVASIITGKRVLITGAGGSIGSELARVCAGFHPEQIILMERAENALFEIDHHIARRFPNVARKAVLHDVIDAEQTQRLLSKLRPHAVFHAAAHKHVPLMEDHPSHAVNNNLFGTKSIADASIACGVERFVMISSDKAVNPTSVMGATKRLAEQYVSHLARSTAAKASGSRLSMVRFGNVLASACSVIPIWSQQLAEGGPITVTDPRMTRYFMTIPEAATLVVQAGALDQPAGQAPVYVLDMGEAISILEMAVRFIRLNGIEPRIDESTIPTGARGAALPSFDDEYDAATIPVVFTGARPGEKLFEELAYSAENLKATSHPGINQWSSERVPDAQQGEAMVREMERFRKPDAEPTSVVEAIGRFVPEMKRSK
jgi:FlaA1/EpsC-like NDP-sugar epimerase